MNSARSVVLAFTCFFLGGVPSFAAAKPFQFQDVIDRAKALSAKPFQGHEDRLPANLKDMGYDQWRELRFKEEQTLWGADKIPFKARFFHPGFLFKSPVAIHHVDARGIEHPFTFSPSLFDYGHEKELAKNIPDGLGFAGFRLHYPINTPEYLDEIAAFLGASYFRCVPQGLRYGMSARGLALGTALPSGEEFPYFTEFWLVKPRAKDKHVTVYALLDSPSVTGAYEYRITPGTETTMEVRSRLFVRQRIAKIGIAPLTSMYFYGENAKAPGNNDFRPEVHDSDGLLIHTRSGQWIWRPLDNPPQLAVNSFYVGAPQGFGLLQRDTDFNNYQDLEARYDIRPSVWVEPAEDWGKGHVELVQIPTPNEYNDNMNAFWVPEKMPEPGDVLDFSYRMVWHNANNRELPLGHVTDTGIAREGDGARFIVDFVGKEINALPADTAIAIDVTLSRGYKVVHQQVLKNVVSGGWRLIFQIQMDKESYLQELLPSRKDPAELSIRLKNGPRILTETWTYTYNP